MKQSHNLNMDNVIFIIEDNCLTCSHFIFYGTLFYVCVCMFMCMSVCVCVCVCVCDCVWAGGWMGVGVYVLFYPF